MWTLKISQSLFQSSHAATGIRSMVRGQEVPEKTFNVFIFVDEAEVARSLSSVSVNAPRGPSSHIILP